MGCLPRVCAIVSVCLMALAVQPAEADPRAAAAKQKQAARLVADGDYPQAMTVIDEGLALAPGHLPLLQLRAATLFEMRDFEGALTAYETFLAAGPKGANKRAAARIITNLAAVRTTKLDLTIPGATAELPASVYLDTRSLGVFCTAAPRCERGIPPGDYKLLVDRPGWKKLNERVTIARDQTLTLERALVEEASPLTVGATGAAAIVVLDGKELGPAPQALSVEAGDHTIEVRAAGFATERRTVAAHLGEPIALELAMRPLVPFAVNVEGADVRIGATAVPREQAALALPDGAQVVTVAAKGFRTQTIEVPALRPAGYRLEVTLAPAPARITVEGAPRGAVVSVDGEAVGTTPLTAPIEVEQGEHAITVTAAGRAPFRTSVRATPDAALQLEVTAMPSTSRRWVWLAATGTGAALLSWGAFGSLALERESTFEQRAGEAGVSRADAMLTSIADRGRTYATVSDISLGLAVVGAGAATWLYLKEGRGEAAGRITPVVAPGAVGVSGSF